MTFWWANYVCLQACTTWSWKTSSVTTTPTVLHSAFHTIRPGEFFCRFVRARITKLYRITYISDYDICRVLAGNPANEHSISSGKFRIQKIREIRSSQFIADCTYRKTEEELMKGRLYVLFVLRGGGFMWNYKCIQYTVETQPNITPSPSSLHQLIQYAHTQAYIDIFQFFLYITL